MRIALFVNDNGLPIAVPGVHACAHELETSGFEVRVYDFFSGEPAELLSASEPPGLVVLWRSNSFDGELPSLDAWLPGASARALAIKQRFPGTRVVLAGWLEFFKSDIETRLASTAFDAAFLSGYEFSASLLAWLANPTPAAVYQWPERTTVRKRTLAAHSGQYAWPGRFIMATPPICDRLCRKCGHTEACLRAELDTAPEALSRMLAEFKAEVHDAAAKTHYIYVATLDIGHQPEVLEAIREAAIANPHLKWFLALSLHAGIPAGALDALQDIPLGGLELFCPSLIPESMMALGLAPRDLIEACAHIASTLPADAYLEVSSYIGLPGDSPARVEQAWERLSQVSRVDNQNFIPLYLDTASPLYQEGLYTLDPAIPRSLFGREGWQTATIDSEWIRAWLEQTRPALPAGAPLVSNVYWLQYMFHLVMNGFSPEELRALRKLVAGGQLEAAQRRIEARGQETQLALITWAQRDSTGNPEVLLSPTAA